MLQLKTYDNLEEKKSSFANYQHWSIDTVEDFDYWYKAITGKDSHVEISSSKHEHNQLEDITYNKCRYIFRGVGDARYKIYSSGQRQWNCNNMAEWTTKSYLEFINDLLEEARKLPLLDRVFRFYKLAPIQRDFPLMSILQHYGAPTPLIDWTYNVNVALYFATEFCGPGTSSQEIDRYFSVNIIDRNAQSHREFLNILQFNPGSFPRLSSLYDSQKSVNTIFYLSDFENRFTKRSSKGFQDQRPLTILFNQRIIQQEGLFIFNPSPTIALEDCFNNIDSKRNLNLAPIICVNIHKDLSDYVRRKIKVKDINKGFIYPDLVQDAGRIKEIVLDNLFR